ncbi:hypothetical protein TeGR_g1981 [Tetraparma gracilis]|uniref:Uncharacterized protein n=1 Tax=Tetraparma gracilis TaxID=2962635 RepID=A0ABQ6MZH0_9STRA|nr:hypothetical protein TeGR_g1981 [Tetraparma gracilis]
MSLERPDAPTVFVPAPPPSTAKHAGEVSTVAWNSQVAHIVASGDGVGAAIVWDLRQKKPWCELRDPSRAGLTAVQWNPTEGLHLVTATGSDADPVLKLWDLRSSTTMPLATLQGHTGGILAADWNPHDPRLLVSSGKDGRTILWDLFDLRQIDELPQDAVEAKPVSQGMFGGAAASQQKRYDVRWSKTQKGVLST